MIQHLGRYQIIRELGRGGMGIVYKALDPNLERHVAIKCLNEELSQDELVVARFLREARNVAALNHPNCVRLYLADEHEGQPYFVMEYVDGESLAEYLAKNGRCVPEMASRIIRECAEALAAADEKNIVHHDVKPGNVMLDRNGRALLTDFGIACVQYGEASTSSTVMGTPGYMAPELIEHGRSDRRVDIFALGAVWYEMLLGERLLPEDDLSALMARYTTEGFPDLSAIEQQFGAETAAILGRMLARDPEARYSSYSQLLEALRPGHVAQTQRQQQTAPTIVASGAGGVRAATTALGDRTTQSGNPGIASPDPTRSVPVTGTRRYRLLAIAGGVLAGVGLIGFAIALTGGLGGDDDGMPANSTIEAPNTVVQQEPVPPTVAPADGRVTGSTPGSSLGFSETSSADRSGSRGASATALLDQLRPSYADPPATDRQAPNGSNDMPSHNVPAPPSEQLALVDTSMVAPRPVAEPESAANRSPPPRSAPRGVTVLGVGDPRITEPMRNEIEAHLRQRGKNVTDPAFIRNVNNYVLDDGLELSGLTDAASDAGIRYAVLVRARPVGTRELQFYGRYDTAYSVQVEAMTYDLIAGNLVGSSSVEQLEYTSLNAAKKARELVIPWLTPIGDQFGN